MLFLWQPQLTDDKDGGMRPWLLAPTCGFSHGQPALAPGPLAVAGRGFARFALDWRAPRPFCAPSCSVHRSCCLVDLLSRGLLLRELCSHTVWSQEKRANMAWVQIPVLSSHANPNRSPNASVSCSAWWALWELCFER